MDRFCRLWTVALLSSLSLLAVTAQATNRAAFFGVTQRPSVAFDRTSMTWTLSNQAIERVIRYDSKAGSLRTIAFRDLKRAGRELRSAATSEGAFSFAAPMMEPPRTLTGWKMTQASPPPNWTQPDYVDTAWKPAPLPYATEQAQTLWLRGLIPEGRMIARRAYALILERAFDGEAEVFVDNTLALKIAAGENPAKRTYQIDLQPANRVIAIKFTGKRINNGIGIAEVGTSPPNIELDKDWKYMIHTVNRAEDGSEILTISLAGLKANDGFDVDVCYQIHAGEEPILAKWFHFVSHRTTRYLLEQAVYDRWTLPGAQPERMPLTGSGFVASDPVSRDAVLTAVLSAFGSSEPGADGKSVAALSRPYSRVKQNDIIQTPKSLTGFFRGTPATGAFLYQIYTGQYVSRVTPASLLTAYNTRYGYGPAINAATCEKIIPMAAAMGAKLFVLDDGWQTNGMNATGRYGDWNVDRSPDKFPLGLLPLSFMVRQQGMRFGLWAAPAFASEGSLAIKDHPDLLVKHADGSIIPYDGDGQMLCFTSGWEENFSQSMQLLCRELSISHLHLDGPLFEETCAVPTHDHPVGHGLRDQEEHWRDFTNKMRKVDRTFLVSRGREEAPEATAISDFGVFGEWEVSGDPKRMADPKTWQRNADLFRNTLYNHLWARPTFTMAGRAPCRLPTANLPALEYALTSVAATVPALELHGKPEEMTVKEQNLVAQWVKWNEDNRPWLAYTQPIPALGKPYDPRDPNVKPHLDGVMHLRPAQNRRFGYICLWNPTDAPARAAFTLNPADYFLRMNPDEIEILRVKDKKPVKFAAKSGTFQFDFPVDSRSWEIYEVRLR